ncbi:MAG TPA: hypothetical protein VJH92_05845 [Candidatus Nanoarchaeia archaeon]|nr:hypothetical protein [Candidatus Nanoarchaeia archaeon]
MALIDLIRRYAVVKVNTRINNGQAYVEAAGENLEYGYFVDSLQIAMGECANNLLKQYPGGDIELETKMKIRIK